MPPPPALHPLDDLFREMFYVFETLDNNKAQKSFIKVMENRLFKYMRYNNIPPSGFYKKIGDDDDDQADAPFQ